MSVFKVADLLEAQLSRLSEAEKIAVFQQAYDLLVESAREIVKARALGFRAGQEAMRLKAKAHCLARSSAHFTEMVHRQKHGEKDNAMISEEIGMALSNAAQAIAALPLEEMP